MKHAWLILLLSLMACAADAPVGHDYNPTVDFSEYRSFGFDPTSVSSREGSVAHDPRVLETIRDTIRDDLGSRPMAEVESDGDLSVAISLVVGEQTGVDQWGVTWNSEGVGAGGQSFQYKAGTLVIDFFDTATGQLVWRSWAESAVTRTGDPDLEFLAELVRAMLAQYPPSTEES